MKWSPEWRKPGNGSISRGRRWVVILLAALAGAAAVAGARDAIPFWLQYAESGSQIESAVFRTMYLPGGAVMARRAPRESRPLLDELVNRQPDNAELYSLRALQEEQQLDFTAAERDWRFYAARAADRTAAQLALADFHHRRVQPAEEIQDLSVVAQAPPSLADQLLPAARQKSWQAFERILALIAANALPAEISDTQYRAWVARYPRESQIYVRYFQFLLGRKEFDRALAFLPEYARAFPQDDVFGVKARALVEYRRGKVEQGLAVYEQSFHPLWPQELVQGYFELLRDTQNLRRFQESARAALRANPGDLGAAARLYYYYQQQGNSAAALQVITEFRQRKESAHTAWKPEELYILARLCEQAQAPAEAARYYFALYNAQGLADSRERALAGLASLLLDAPQQSIRLGSGDLSIYKDIATLDAGPGFFNGILSLLLNSASPQQSLVEEEQRAIPYFHRARAAQLVALLDQQFPSSSRRPALHARLIRAFADYGESEAVVHAGREFLQSFPNAAERTTVSLLMAGAYARLDKPDDELAVYDAVLGELGRDAQHVPIGAETLGGEENTEVWRARQETSAEQPGGEENTPQPDGNSPESHAAFAVKRPEARPATGPRSAEYAPVLERALARLIALHRLPQALAVLRREVERNPDDPGLYLRLAQFLEQNQLDAQVEDVYRRAMQQFPDRSWYHKLARWYLRQKREADFEQLTQQVVKIFSGSDLESYFRNTAWPAGPHLYLQVNLYANRRFPHDLAFVRNLLNAYSRTETYDPAAREDLLRRHWFEADDLRAWYFSLLSSTHRLEPMLADLRSTDSAIAAGRWGDAARANPAAVQFCAEADLWESHFEAGLPALGALAAEFPADFEIGRRTSAVYRSLAYLDPKNTDAAVGIEGNLLEADPGNRDTLARIGDIYADRDLILQAAPYWTRMAQIEPGKPDSYVQAATVFWDYYRFDEALRLLNLGRQKLGNPALFGYEEGAIYENMRDYPRALEQYVRGALVAGESSQAYARLLELARRPKLRDLADRSTQDAQDPASPSLPAIRLRLHLLEVQQRNKDAEAFLSEQADRAASLEIAEALETLGAQRRMSAVQERALERQAALATDPVARLQLRYRLAQFYEAGKNYEAAQSNIETLYRENPRILGVVRATVDFYWRRRQRERAVGVLLDAAKAAYPGLRTGFTFEAARKDTEIGNFAQARQLLDTLLQQSPYEAEYLAAMADTYARAGDDRGLRDFYLAKIELFRQAPLAPDQRTERIAALRRGLIPALTRLKDFSGAVDQYVELINRYPEDQGLVAEAAVYAQDHGVSQKLLAFYTKTVADSPRDFRWPMVLARMETSLEDYPAAIAAYGKSIAVRPDRTDLYTARADLFERLARFDEAATDYDKLYALAYHDPKWMEKVAEIRARQGKVEDTLRALRLALIEGRPPGPANFFAAARSLESWGMYSQALDLAQQGLDAAGNDLLANAENHAGARLYTRVMALLRKQDAALTRLNAALAGASQSPSSVEAVVRQAEKEGIAAVTDSEWREREQKVRIQSARAGMQLCAIEAGTTAARYFTPEERLAFARQIEQRATGMPLADVGDFLVPAAEAAGLAELEARWRNQLMMADPLNSSAQMSRLIDLQTRRLKFSELAGQLETLAATLPEIRRGPALSAAAAAYRSEGDDANELRLLPSVDRWSGMSSELLQHYFDLLRKYRPESLQDMARRGSVQRRDAAGNFAVGTGDPKLAYQVLAARGADLPPVWQKAYTGLAGLYFADTSAHVNTAYLDALGDQTIGERLGKAVDRNQQLAGNIWFYYASRYGEYLGVTRQGDAEDFLPAVLEAAPGNPDAYRIAAESFEDAGDLARAAVDLRHALEIDGANPRPHSQLAEIYWKQSDREHATGEWKRALGALAKQVDRRAVPESFWSDFAGVVKQLQEHHLAVPLLPEISAVVKPYLRKNGAYRAVELLAPVYRAQADPNAGVSWLLEMSTAAREPVSILGSTVGARWIPLRRRQPLFERILDLQRTAADKAQGDEQEPAIASLRAWQVRWVRYLIETSQFQPAADSLAAIPASAEGGRPADLESLRLEIVAGLGTLDAVLQGYRAQPDTAPDASALLRAARELELLGRKPAAQKILEYVYSHAIENHDLSATNFLGLAEIRLEAGDLPGGLQLLQRLTLVVGQPFENLGPAADLLEKTHHLPESADFLERRVAATPWDLAARLHLARLRAAGGKDAATSVRECIAIAASPLAPYSLRTAAAAALVHVTPRPSLGSGELDLLASARAIPEGAANKRFFLPARRRAASETQELPQRISLLRAALEDDAHADAARPALFYAAADSRQDALAYSVLEPVLRRGFLAAQYRGEAEPETEGAEPSDQREASATDAEAEESPAPAPSALPALSKTQKARLAARLAAVEEHLGRHREAIRHLQNAETWESNAVRLAAVRRDLARLRQEVERQVADAARRPLIHGELEQNRVVRPRFPAVAENTPPARPGAERRQP